MLLSSVVITAINTIATADIMNITITATSGSTNTIPATSTTAAAGLEWQLYNVVNLQALR